MEQMEKHLQGDYEANGEKEVQGGEDRETSTMTKQIQMLGSLQFPGTVLDECISTNSRELPFLYL